MNDEFTKKRMDNEFVRLIEERKSHRDRLGISADIGELLDALSLVLAEDTETGLNRFMQERATILCNVESFLSVYDRCAAKYPALLAKRSSDGR